MWIMEPARTAYSEFVTDIFSAITEIMPSDNHSLLTFSAGEISRSETNEVAYLRNEKALYFYRNLLSNSDLFQIDPSTIILQRSLIFNDEVAIRHSCYAKNLRRWMKGQIPRKRRCRVDFAVLSYCWITAFGSDRQYQLDYQLCKSKVKRICRSIISDIESDIPLLNMIWYASCKAYMTE